MTITHILCPVDFSDFSRHAVAHAVALAKWYGARLTLLHVWSAAPPPMPYGEAPAMLGLLPEQRSRIAAELNDLAAPYRESGLRIGTAVSEGPSVHEILSVASSAEADLIVMGTHGRGGFERLVLGSVTEKVLRKAKMPVLTVPARVDAEQATHVLYSRILCPLDAPSPDNPALRAAISLARETDGRITLLHVVEPIQAPPGLTDFDAPAYTRRLEEDWRARLHAAIDDETRTWCRFEDRVLVGRPAEGILASAEELRADVIVMGVQGRGALDLMLFGSTTHQVVRQATCPVLTVRRDGAA
jgi:nucleotide-binding universal stress UspA family protein